VADAPEEADLPEEQVQREPTAQPAGSPSPLRIGELLLRRALIDQDDLALALSEQSLNTQSPPLGRLLVRLGAIDEDVLSVTLAEQSGMRIVDLGPETRPDPSALDRIPREAAFRLQALPMHYQEGRLVVALAEPPTRETRREILKTSARQPDFVLAIPSVLAAAIERWYPHPSVVIPPLDGPSTTIDVEPVRDELQTRQSLVGSPKPEHPLGDTALHFRPDGRVNVAHSEPEPAAGVDDRVVGWLLSHAADLGASSVHLIEEPSELRVRARIDGRMRDTTTLPAAAGTILVRRMLRASGLETDSHATQTGWLLSTRPGFGEALHVRTALTSSGRTVVVRSANPERARARPTRSPRH
jgi:type IV pilus assembly protein PilB